MNTGKIMKKDYAEKFLQFLTEEKQLEDFSARDQKKIQKDWDEFSRILSESRTIEEVPERYREFAGMYMKDDSSSDLDDESELITDEIVDTLLAEIDEGVEDEIEEESPKSLTLVDDLKQQLSEVKIERKEKKKKKKKSSLMDDYITVQGQRYGDIKSMTRQARFEKGILPWNFTGAAAHFWEEMDRVAKDNPNANPEEIREVATPAFFQKVEEGGYNCNPAGRVKTLFPYWKRYSNLSPVRK